MAPSGTPSGIITRLNLALVKGWQSGDTHKRLEADGSEPVTSTPQTFATLIRSETEKWTRIIKDAGITPQ